MNLKDLKTNCIEYRQVYKEDSSEILNCFKITNWLLLCLYGFIYPKGSIEHYISVAYDIESQKCNISFSPLITDRSCRDHKVKIGDWIVLETRANVFIYTEEQFKKLFSFKESK